MNRHRRKMCDASPMMTRCIWIRRICPVNLSDVQTVAEVLKPALKEIWRHNGHRGMPIFDGNNVQMEA